MGKKKSKNLFSGHSDKKSKDDRRKRDRDDHKKKNKRRIRAIDPEISINKEERNKMRKLAEKPVEVPEENQKIRNNCNHQTKILTIEEFDQAGFSRNIVPALDLMIQVFGKNNIGICSACYDIVILNQAIRLDDVKKAICTLYGAANFVVANSQIKKSEIKGIAQTKNTMLTDWMAVLNRFREILQEDSRETYDESASDDDISRLNRDHSVVTG